MQDGPIPAEEIPEQDAANGWLTLAEAARRVGCSIDTVRRRLKRGELESRQVAARHGLAWQVRLSGLQTVGGDPAQPAQSPGVAELVRLVGDQQQTILELSGRCGFLQAQVQQLRAALEAPKAAEMAQEPTPDHEAAPEPVTRPWWRFWR